MFGVFLLVFFDCASLIEIQFTHIEIQLFEIIGLWELFKVRCRWEVFYWFVNLWSVSAYHNCHSLTYIGDLSFSQSLDTAWSDTKLLVKLKNLYVHEWLCIIVVQRYKDLVNISKVSSYLPARLHWPWITYLYFVYIYIDCIDKINSNALKIFKSLQKHLLLVNDPHCFILNYSVHAFIINFFSAFDKLVNWYVIHIKFEFIYRSLKLTPTPVPYQERLCILLTDAQRLRKNGKKLQKERTAQLMHTIVLIPKNFCTIVLSIHTSMRHWRSVPLERI